MWGDQPLCYGFGIRSCRERRLDREYPLEEIKSHLSNFDLLLGNLEGTIAGPLEGEDDVLPIMSMRGDDDAVEVMAQSGIGLVALANNHILEHGPKVMTRTVELLDLAGIKHIGSKWCSHRIELVNGLRIGFMAWSMVPEHHSQTIVSADWYNLAADLTPILEEIKLVRPGCDHLVLMLHWGNEFMSRPSMGQQSIARELADSGVDVIFGHHPHVIQPLETYGSSHIFYSLGNLVFDSWLNVTRDSIVADVELGDDISASVVPVRIDREFRPRLAVDSDAERIEATVGFGQSVPDCEYPTAVARMRSWYRRRALVHFALNIWRYSRRDLVRLSKWLWMCTLFIIRTRRASRLDPNVVYRGPMW